MEEKKISIFRSLPAKMFYYMAALTIVVTAGTSYQNHSGFSKFLAEHSSSELVSRAETAKSQVEAQLENWNALTGSVVPGYNEDKKIYGEALTRLVEANSDFIAIQVFKGLKDGTNLELLAEGRTKKTNDVRFEEKVGTGVLIQSLADSQRLIPQKAKLFKANQRTAVHSLAMKTKLPIMMMISRYDLPDNPDVLWSLLITWQTPLLKSLPKSDYIDSALVDSNGHIFSSNNLLLMTTKNKFSSEKITAAATSARKISAIVEEYQSNTHKKVFGGYSRSPKFGLAVVVEENFDRATAEINNSGTRTILWTLLFILLAAMLAYVGSSGTLKSTAEVQQAIRRIGKGHFDHGIVLNANDEISLLASDLNSAGSDIVKLMKNDTARQLAALEVNTAKTMQSCFFPRKNILSKNLRVAGFYQPSNKCGGDLWGHYELQEDLHLLFVADAMGVGVQAALVTAMTYSVGATISRLAAEKNSSLEKPSEILRHINEIVWEAFQGTMSLTFFCTIIDTKNGKMTYANAGHNFPFVIPVHATDSRITRQPRPGAEKKPQPFSIKLMGNPLGLQKVATYADKEIAIEPGDKIFLFSDGLIECSSPHGEVWGRKYLFNQLSEITTLPFDEFKDEILSRAFTFFGNKPLADDVTVVVAEIPKAWNSQRIIEKVSRRPSVPLPITSGVVSAPLHLPIQATEATQESKTLYVERHAPEQATLEIADIDVAMETGLANSSSFSPILEILESELEVLSIELGFNQEVPVAKTINSQESQLVAETPKDLFIEQTIFSEVDPELQENQRKSEDKAAFEIAFAMNLNGSAQEISTHSSTKEEGFTNTQTEPVPVEKKARKGRYKVRLPQTG